MPALLVAGLLLAAAPTLAAAPAIIVNDTWADGSRLEQNLPAESHWIAANRATNFIASAGNLRFLTDFGGSRAGLTYFAPAGSPVTVTEGFPLVATLAFTTTGTVSSNANRSMRFGLFNYTGATRLTADGTSSGMSGAGVTGYGLFLNQPLTFGDEPFQLLERTTVSSTDLLGAGAAWTTLGEGGGVAGDPGLVDGTLYTLTLTLARTGSVLDFTARLWGGALDITHTVTDPSPSTFSFDAFAIRNSRGDQTSAFYDISNFKVEVIPEPTSASLLSLGLLALWRLRCRRKETK